jgi:hypothetical protein
MAGAKGRRRKAGRGGKADRLGTAVRLALLAWEVAQVLVREHVLLGAGRGGLL